MSTREYHERLSAPLRWWLIVTVFLFTIWLALVVATPPALSWTVLGVCALLGYGQVLKVGSESVEIRDGDLHAGRARIPLDLLGAPQALDAVETRDKLSVGADARAYLFTRSYLKKSVVVPVLDPADPAPYWLLGTRHPERLAVALGQARATPDDPGAGSKHRGDPAPETPTT